MVAYLLLCSTLVNNFHFQTLVCFKITYLYFSGFCFQNVAFVIIIIVIFLKHLKFLPPPLHPSVHWNGFTTAAWVCNRLPGASGTVLSVLLP